MKKSTGGCDLNELRRRVRNSIFFESKHLLIDRAYRQLTVDMIIEAVGYDKPKICEDYPNARPWPKCLILGWLKIGTPLHVVIAYTQYQTLIVTAYANPDNNIWYNDLCTRR